MKFETESQHAMFRCQMHRDAYVGELKELKTYVDLALKKLESGPLDCGEDYAVRETCKDLLKYGKDYSRSISELD